ncbi:MAG: outer membrane beta-barrel protein [Bacteroidales bacterium]|nr:outer membrane beta-barrel protein [Bacteroidales bacterium]
MKHTIIFLMLLALTYGAYAQPGSKGSNGLTVTVGGGINGLSYKLDGYGDKKFHAGFRVNVGYQHYFTPKIGVSAGLAFLNFRTDAILNYMQSIENAIDEEDNPYTHRTYFHNLEEAQKQNYLALPVEFLCKIPLNADLKVLLGGGVFAGLAFQKEFRTRSGYLETRRYFIEQNLEVDGDYPQYHLYKESDFVGDFDTKINFGGIFESSILYSIDKQTDVRIGLYGMYSFAPQNQKNEVDLYNPDCMSSSAYSATEYHGVLNSALVDKVCPFAVGVEVGVCYRF